MMVLVFGTLAALYIFLHPIALASLFSVAVSFYFFIVVYVVVIFFLFFRSSNKLLVKGITLCVVSDVRGSSG